MNQSVNSLKIHPNLLIFLLQYKAEGDECEEVLLLVPKANSCPEIRKSLIGRLYFDD